MVLIITLELLGAWLIPSTLWFCFYTLLLCAWILLYTMFLETPDNGYPFKNGNENDS